MPATVNGIGTHYYGKRNRSTRTGVCRACGNHNQLESYDARLWFVVFFIPLIPLRRKRIIDQCSICSRHIAADQSQFEMARQLNVSGVKDRYREQPTPENALEVHACLLAFHQHEEAEEFRRQALLQHADSAVLHCGLALHLVEVGQVNAALPLFEKAYVLRPDLPEARVGVARIRMADGRLDEARELLGFLAVAGAGQLYSLEPLETLARAYQEAGQHAAVLTLCKHLLTEFPAVGEDREFRKFVAKSEKALAREESILPKQSVSLRGLFDAKSGRYSKWQRRTAIAAVVALLVVAGLAVANEYRRRHRTVYAVCDCGRPVEVTIDDDAPVAVNGLTKLQVAEGRHRVRVGEPVNDEFEFEMGTGYFERWTKTPGWVLNVDGGAALVSETLRYAARPRPSEIKLLVGERFLYMPHVDYLFATAPKSLQTDKKDGEVVKTRLDRAGEPAHILFLHAVHEGDSACAFRFAEARLRRNPDDSFLLAVYVQEMQRLGQVDRAKQYFRAGLTRRPVAVAWHRAYQHLDIAAGKEAELAAEYDGLLQKEPDNAPLLYLRGRVDAETAKGREFFQRACKADAACPWPWMALAYDAAARGDWQESRTLADKAFALQLADPSLLQVRHLARLATGDAAAMEAEYRQAMQAGSPLDRILALIDLCDVLAAQGKGAAARQAVADWEQQLPGGARGSDVANECRLYAAYMTGEAGVLQEMQPGAASRCSPEFRLQVLAATGRAQDLVQDAELQSVLKEPWNALAVSLAFHIEGKPAAADARRWTQRATQALTDNLDTHPSLSDRLRALGQPAGIGRFPDVPRPSAAGVLLGERLDSIRRDVDALWQRQIEETWRGRHSRAIALQHRLTTLEQSPAAPESDPGRLWEQARATADLSGPEAAEPLLRRLLAVQPAHSAANLVLGRILLERGCPEGERLLQAILDKEDDELIPDACQALDQHFQSAGRERSAVSASDRFLAHGLTPDELAALQGVLAVQSDLGAAYLARKELKHFPRQRLFVLCVRSAAGFWSPSRGERDAAVAAALVPRVTLPGRAIVISPHAGFRRLGRKIAALHGAQVFPTQAAGGDPAGFRSDAC